MTDIDTVTRFAPSPTGNLHLGNARTALFRGTRRTYTDEADAQPISPDDAQPVDGDEVIRGETDK